MFSQCVEVVFFIKSSIKIGHISCLRTYVLRIQSFPSPNMNINHHTSPGMQSPPKTLYFSSFLRNRMRGLRLGLGGHKPHTTPHQNSPLSHAGRLSRMGRKVPTSVNPDEQNNILQKHSENRVFTLRDELDYRTQPTIVDCNGKHGQPQNSPHN